MDTRQTVWRALPQPPAGHQRGWPGASGAAAGGEAGEPAASVVAGRATLGMLPERRVVAPCRPDEKPPRVYAEMKTARVTAGLRMARCEHRE